MRIAKELRCRERVVGTHFWNPPHAVRLLEVVQAEESRAQLSHKLWRSWIAIGQEPVHVKKNIPGFINNCRQQALKRKAIALVQAGVCDARTFDFVVRRRLGALLGAIGPLEQADLGGLDLILAIHKIVIQDIDVTPDPQKFLVDLVAAGHTGASTGQSFRTGRKMSAPNCKSASTNSFCLAARSNGRGPSACSLPVFYLFLVALPSVQ
jgi:3-hydroxybutyryl-CoA dehydrogenase